jgi:hypothetical protein
MADKPARLPRIQDLDPVTLKKGRNYYVGRLLENSTALPYLRKNAVVAHLGSMHAFWSMVDDLDMRPGGGLFMLGEGDNRKRTGKDSDNKGGNGFNTFKSLAETRDIYVNRPGEIRKFTEESLRLKADESIGKEIRYDVVGDYIDIGRFLEGQPECFGVAYQGNPSGLYVTILLNTVAVSFIEESIMNHKQARLLRLVDWMESQGVTCRIEALASTAIGHATFVVKQFGEAVDMNQVATAGHSETLRRLFFLLGEQSETWEGGYGMPKDLTRAMTKSYRAQPEDGLTIFLGDSSHNDKDRVDASFDKLREKIEQLLEQPAEQRDFDKVYAVEL